MSAQTCITSAEWCWCRLKIGRVRPNCGRIPPGAGRTPPKCGRCQPEVCRRRPKCGRTRLKISHCPKLAEGAPNLADPPIDGHCSAPSALCRLKFALNRQGSMCRALGQKVAITQCRRADGAPELTALQSPKSFPQDTDAEWQRRHLWQFVCSILGALNRTSRVPLPAMAGLHCASQSRSTPSITRRPTRGSSSRSPPRRRRRLRHRVGHHGRPPLMHPAGHTKHPSRNRPHRRRAGRNAPTALAS